MGLRIRDKTQIAAPVGSEAFPVSTVAPADGFMTLDQIIASGRQVYNVKKYGAVGNGSTDDHTAIQNAIDAAGTAGGGVVYLPAAAYYIGSQLLMNKSGVTLLGDGIGATFIRTNILLSGDSTFDAILIKPTSFTYSTPADLGGYLLGCSVRDLTIDHYRATTNASCGLKMIGNTFLLIEDVEVLNFGGGIYCGASLLTMYERMRSSVTNKGNVNPTMYGIQISSAEGPADTMRFHNCGVFSGFQTGGGGPGTMNTSPHNYVGWYLGGGHGIQDVMVSDCESDNGDICLLVDGGGHWSAGVGAFDVHFYNFACDFTGGQTVIVQNCTSSEGSAIDFDGGICDGGVGYQIINSSGVTIRGVQFNGTSTASVSFSGACTDCSVTSCTSRGPVGDHIVIGGASNFIAIGNNNLITNAANANARGVWITGSSTDSTVTGNTIRGTGGTGKSVLIDSGCARIAVVGNAGGGSGNFVDTPAVNSLGNNV